MKRVLPSFRYLLLDDSTSPNLVLVSRQIDGLREVLRRMKASQSESIDSIITNKLNQHSRDN
ncbi:MAG: hypothetical protein AAF490_12430 [Chloroflexota bacterium]